MPVLLAMLIMIMSGCSGLILRSDDSGEEKTGKVIARILLCPITFCMSELGIAGAKQEEKWDLQLAQRRQWLQSLSPQERAQENALEAARLQALGMALSGGPPISFPPPMYRPAVQPALPVPMPASQPTMQKPMNCTYQHVGTQTYQNCY